VGVGAWTGGGEAARVTPGPPLLWQSGQALGSSTVESCVPTANARDDLTGTCWPADETSARKLPTGQK